MTNPPLPNADELEVVAFQHIAKTKLDALLAEGWKINGYSVQKDGRLGLVTTGGFVGWYSNACDNSAAADARAEAAEAEVKRLTAELAAANQAVDAFSEICVELGVERDDEAGLIAAHNLKEEAKRLREALGGAGQQAENAAWNIGKPGHKFTPADIQQGFFNIMEFCRSALSGGTRNDR
jgi:hypothetical protein